MGHVSWQPNFRIKLSDVSLNVNAFKQRCKASNYRGPALISTITPPPPQRSNLQDSGDIRAEMEHNIYRYVFISLRIRPVYLHRELFHIYRAAILCHYISPERTDHQRATYTFYIFTSMGIRKRKSFGSHYRNLMATIYFNTPKKIKNPK